MENTNIITDINFSFPQSRIGQGPDNYPDPTQEIEAKYRLTNIVALRTMLHAIIKAPDIELVHIKDEIYWTPDYDTKNIALTSCPISWYADDDKNSMLDAGNSLRSRFSRLYNDKGRIYIPKEVQHCVKDDGAQSDITAISSRHEDEVYANSLTLNFNMFSNARTKELLNGADQGTLSYYFASDVKRKMITVKAKIDGQNGLFEMAFDKIKYKRPNLNEDGSPNANTPSGKPIVTFATQDEMENEYKNIWARTEEYKQLIEQHNLSPLTNDQINRAQHNFHDRFTELAKKHGLHLWAEPQSKGMRGFEALEKHNSENGEQLQRHAVSFDHDDLEDFLPK